MSDAIPKRYSNANDPDHPVTVSTVGELRAALDHLPNDLRIGYPGEAKAVIVFNVGHESQHLGLEDAEDWDDFELDD